MDQKTLHNLIERIVAEVVRRAAILERQARHPERVLVLVAAPPAYPKELNALLQAQFGVGYTPVSFAGQDGQLDPLTQSASELCEAKLTEMATQAETVALVAPRLSQLSAIAAGEDGELLPRLLIRSILWKKDVRLYPDFDPPRFRRNTFLEGVASAIDTLRQMGVTVCPYHSGESAAQNGATLITEADVLRAAQSKDRRIRARVGAIITPAARDALLTSGVAVQYEGENVCN